jgi:6-phosphogluconate dehydrogenase
MTEKNLCLGIIGLGKMGSHLALQCIDKGIAVTGKTLGKNEDLEKKGVKVVDNYQSFVNYLHVPRTIYLSLPAGGTIDKVLDELVPHLNNGDVIMDGGNSFYQDSINREKRMSEKGIYYLDTGTSGGISGALYGACFMVGGKKEGIKLVEPLLTKLAVPGGFVHTGAPGTGHFVKLVHNGIEFGMLQAIGEGVSLMIGSGFDLDLKAIFENWCHGSVIRSWLVELMAKGLKEQQLNSIQAYIEDTGEVNWLVQDAINKEIPIPVISQSIMELFRSRTRESDTYRAIALMRHGFGGHPFGPDAYIQDERRTSRIQGI